MLLSITVLANSFLEQALPLNIRNGLLGVSTVEEGEWPTLPHEKLSQFQRRQPGVCVSECLSIERATACTTGSCACGYLNRVTLEYIENCSLCLLTINEDDALLLPLLANMCLCSNDCLAIINGLLPAYYCSTDTCVCASVNSENAAAWNTCISCVQTENPLNATVLLNIEQQCASSLNSTPSNNGSASSSTGISTTTNSATTTSVAHSGAHGACGSRETTYFGLPLLLLVFQIVFR